ncbi:RNA 2',3'-cyclic phosphodiesterase [Colwelliaceae bacterium BS250]
MQRLFFGLTIDSNNKQLIANWRSQYIKQDVNFVDPDNFHITLAFLGLCNQQKVEQIVAAVNNSSAEQFSVESFSVELSHLGFWQQPKILFLGCEHCPEQLQVLAEQLKSLALSLDIPQQQRPYMPHLTLARKAKSLEPINTSNNFNIEPISLTFDTFCLFESVSTPSGVKYDVIHCWGLDTTNAS